MDSREIRLIVTVAVALLVREIIRRLNKSKNDAYYTELSKKAPAEVVHLWLKTMARHAIPFQITVIAEIFISLAALITFDYFYPGLTEFTIPLAAILLFLRANKAWMKIIYLRNLGPEIKESVVEYFNQNSKSSIEKVLKDPEITTFFKVLPKFMVTLISKRMRAIKPIPSI